MGARRDVGDAARLLKAGKHNFKPAYLTHDTEQLGQLEDLIIGN